MARLDNVCNRNLNWFYYCWNHKYNWFNIFIVTKVIVVAAGLNGNTNRTEQTPAMEACTSVVDERIFFFLPNTGSSSLSPLPHDVPPTHLIPTPSPSPVRHYPTTHAILFHCQCRREFCKGHDDDCGEGNVVTTAWMYVLHLNPSSIPSIHPHPM